MNPAILPELILYNSRQSQNPTEKLRNNSRISASGKPYTVNPASPIISSESAFMIRDGSSFASMSCKIAAICAFSGEGIIPPKNMPADSPVTSIKRHSIRTKVLTADLSVLIMLPPVLEDCPWEPCAGYARVPLCYTCIRKDMQGRTLPEHSDKNNHNLRNVIVNQNALEYNKACTIERVGGDKEC